MGLREKIKKDKGQITTKDLYFGALEAEGENVEGHRLTDYFEDYLKVLDSLEFDKFIFVGRKGMGKSAIAKYIKDSSDDKSLEDSYASLIKMGDCDLHNLIQGSAEDIADMHKYIFEWLILVRIVQLIVQNDHGKLTVEYDKMRKFLEINSGMVNIDQLQFVSGAKNKGVEVTIGGVKHIFGGVLKKYIATNVDKAPFYKVIPALKEIVKIMLDYPVNKDKEFWVLFDDLDKDFSIKSDKDLDKVRDLLRVARDYNTTVFKDNNASVLIFIRDDIRDKLKGDSNDTSKILGSYEVDLDWYDHNLYTSNNLNEVPLKKLVDTRIEKNFSRLNIEYSGDPWDYLIPIFVSSQGYGGKKSSFKYLLDFTFYRPRDLMAFLLTLTKNEFRIPLDKRSFRLAILNYIGELVSEIKSELRITLEKEEINILFDKVLYEISRNQNMSYLDLKELVNKEIDKVPSDEIIDLLFNYSLIVFNDENDYYYKYRKNFNLKYFNKEEMNISLPKAIYHNYKNLVITEF